MKGVLKKRTPVSDAYLHSTKVQKKAHNLQACGLNLLERCGR